jgi:hypothetical protein
VHALSEGHVVVHVGGCRDEELDEPDHCLAQTRVTQHVYKLECHEHSKTSSVHKDVTSTRKQE